MGLLAKLGSCSARPDAADRPTGAHPLTDEQFHTIARALADPRRFSMLQQIAAAADTLPCSRLDVQSAITPATISHHLRELQEAGLIDAVRDGRTMRLSLQRPVWQQYLTRLAQL